jgi:ATP-dependent Clp protease adaptor protein ClpS
MESNKPPASQGATIAVAPKAKPAKKNKPAQLPPYHVVLLNDDDHTYDYVIEMVKVIFAYPDEKGFQLAKAVDRDGRVILMTTHRELAELKRDQIHAYGTDSRVATCKGSMSSVIEPAQG